LHGLALSFVLRARTLGGGPANLVESRDVLAERARRAEPRESLGARRAQARALLLGGRFPDPWVVRVVAAPDRGDEPSSDQDHRQDDDRDPPTLLAHARDATALDP